LFTACFQIPALPEQAAQALDYKLVVKSMTGTAQPDTFSEEDQAAYKAAWEQPGALTSMINWYRANRHTQLDLDKAVEVPTLMIWGKKDAALGAEMESPSIAKCPNRKLIFLEEATHCLHHEQPEKVNQEILAFLRGSE
jgi:pimeloyl-ACP methyl ester carboxylesterase